MTHVSHIAVAADLAPVDALAVGVHSDGSLSAGADQVNRACGGLLTRLFEQKEFSGKPNETLIVYPSEIPAPVVVLVGLGEPGKTTRQSAHRAAGAAALALAKKPRRSVAFYLGDDWSDDCVLSAVVGAVSGCQGQDLYRAEKKLHPFETLFWPSSQGLLDRASILARAVLLTRRLVNEPPQDLYPESFADFAQQSARESGFEIEVWDQARLEQEKCGALLAVAKGSSRPARLVMMNHRGGPADQPPIAFVGKGVTFDSGGLSLKPSESMLTMKCDMAGAATVLGAMQAVAQWKLPVNVMGLVGLVENMTGPDAMKLGDVLHARNGRTIEVHNTDAEGRLVLADVLSVAVDRGASKIVDLATLTGACCVALGLDIAGLMTNNQDWADQVSAAAGECGEAVWPLPMFPEFGDQIRSEVADVKNVGEGRWGGAMTAAKFLEEFVADLPWVHLDIAGPAFADKPRPWIAAGASGRFVQTLVELAARSAP